MGQREAAVSREGRPGEPKHPGRLESLNLELLEFESNTVQEAGGRMNDRRVLWPRNRQLYCVIKKVLTRRGVAVASRVRRHGGSVDRWIGRSVRVGGRS
jgi:hypothetical protein